MERAKGFGEVCRVGFCFAALLCSVASCQVEQSREAFTAPAATLPNASSTSVTIAKNNVPASAPPAETAEQQAASRVAPPSNRVAESLRRVLPQVKKRTRVPVLLPSELPHTLARQKIYTSADATGDKYSISLSSRPRCGANSCFVGLFEAKRGGAMQLAREGFEEVQLAQGVIGSYKPTTCGGSCSPPQIEWIRDEVLYRLQLEVAWRTKLSAAEEKSLIVQTAISAIEGGAR